MEIIYILIPIALIMGVISLFGFIWATKKGQFDDLDTPAHRMLLDDEEIEKK